jgi:ABC-type branched-subunit amino acid transport system substrate-binding protein
MSPAHLLHWPGPGAATRASYSLANGSKRSQEILPPSADYIWRHVMNEKVRELVMASGSQIVGEEYYPLDRMDYRETVERIAASGADVVFNTIVPPDRSCLYMSLRVR